MARQRGTALGLLPGRLRGGFTASPIPRSSTLIDTASCSPLSPANSPSPSLTDSVSGSSSSDHNDMLRAVLETMKKMDRKIATMEQQQHKITDSVKELVTLVKSQERANFSIKGSAWEVRNTFANMCI